VLVCLILSIIINNIPNKAKLIYYSAFGFIVVALLSTIFQLLQYLNIHDLWFLMEMKGNRFYGNVAQPNQLAFIYALGIAACHHLLIKSVSKRNLLLVIFLALLSIGLALPSS